MEKSWHGLVVILGLGGLAACATSASSEGTLPEDVRAAAEVGRVLDDLHAAAAEADEERYFDHFLPNAFFLGTDATERWTRAAFRAFAAPHFEGETAWTYEPLERHVVLGPAGVAWFDERLWNEGYGETRGSGVLLHDGERWRIAQYVLSFTVPNGASRRVVEVIRGAG